MNVRVWATKLEAIASLIPIIISVAVGMAVLVFGVQASLSETELLNKGSRASGTVIDKNASYDPDEGYTYTVSYTFSTPNAEQLSGGWFIEKPVWDKLIIGSQIEIAFDPANPSQNLPVEGVKATPLWIMPIAAVLFAVVSFVVSSALLKLVRALLMRLTNKLSRQT